MSPDRDESGFNFDYVRFADAQFIHLGNGRRVEFIARRDGSVWRWRTRDTVGWRQLIPTFWKTGDKPAMFAAHYAAVERATSKPMRTPQSKREGSREDK